MNWKLKTGIILLLILIFISVIGPRFAPFEPHFIETLRVIYIDGEKDYLFAPEKPNSRHLLGTDKDGYDVLSMLLYGSKYTLAACFLVALLRITLGLIWGISAGMKRQASKRLEFLGAIPSFLILYFLLANITFNPTMSIVKLFIIQILFIVIIGLPGVVSSIQGKTWLLTKETYIEAAKSSGAGDLRIAFKHIFPHLRSASIIIFMSEMISSLNLIGQLAIFYIFLGGTIATDRPPLLHSITNEWMGIIAQTKNYINVLLWLIIIPMTAYLLIHLSFNMILQGIEQYYGRKYIKTPFI